MADIDTNTDAPEAASIEAQAQAQTGQQQIRLRIDQKNMTTSYANAFRSGTTAEEVMLDFGLNQVVQTRSQSDVTSKEPAGEILFEINNRIVLNYFTAKRLAITIGQIVRRYEDQFGELKLNVSERAQNTGTPAANT